MNIKKETTRKVYTSIIEGKPFSLPYRLYVPKDYTEKQYPLVIFLHGYGECGKDNIKQMVHYHFFDALEKSGEEAIVFIPQTTEDETWCTFIENETRMIGVEEKKYARSLQAVSKMIERLISGYNVDSNRLYVTGLSMGGGATLELALRMPNTFACIAPVCPACVYPTNAKSYENINIWLFHGEVDNTIDINQTYKFAEELKNNNIPYRLSTYPGVDHGSWVNAYAEKELIEFMFSSVKGSYNKFLK